MQPLSRVFLGTPELPLTRCAVSIPEGNEREATIASVQGLVWAGSDLSRSGHMTLAAAVACELVPRFWEGYKFRKRSASELRELVAEGSGAGQAHDCIGYLWRKGLDLRHQCTKGAGGRSRLGGAWTWPEPVDPTLRVHPTPAAPLQVPTNGSPASGYLHTR